MRNACVVSRAPQYRSKSKNLLPVAEGIKQRRHRSNIERVRTQPELVTGNAVQFRQITRIYCARAGASTFISFSTASQ